MLARLMAAAVVLATFALLAAPSAHADDVADFYRGKQVNSIDEARRHDLPPLILGGTAEGATGADVPVILRDTIGLHVKQIVGYPDSPAIFLAIERGEVHGRTTDLSSVKSVKPEWLKPDGGFRVLVQFARATRHPELP